MQVTQQFSNYAGANLRLHGLFEQYKLGTIPSAPSGLRSVRLSCRAKVVH